MPPAPAHLLPPNSGEFAKALSEACDMIPMLDDSIEEIRGWKLTSPPPALLPFLVYEYGLGELSPYVENLYNLIDEGIAWQRVRGTPLALEKGLGFVSYAGTLEEMPTRWKHWNLFMLEMDRLRDNEVPDLKNIDGIANLSVPLRSYFWRGFYDYDIRALELGNKKLGQSLLGSFSGVRIDGVNAKWSYGRLHENEVGLSEAELTQLGVWIAETGDVNLGWGHFTWESLHVPWVTSALAQRIRLILIGLLNRPIWFEYKDSGGGVIGYRKARFSWAVKPELNGGYVFGGADYAIDTDAPTCLLAEALTDFGEGDGQIASSIGLIFDATPLDAAKPGLLWAGPGELTNLSAAVAVQTGLSIEFGKTIRERCRVRLTV